MHRVHYQQELTTGDFIGDYQILSLLGRGFCGSTYHVMNNILKKEFVLKVLYPASSLPLQWKDQLEAQTALLSRLGSVHMDRPLASSYFQNIWFCVKDFVHNGKGKACNLRQYLEKHDGKLSDFQIYHLLRQILLALSEASDFKDAHHQGISHGNLKPENILVAYGNIQKNTQEAPFEIKLSDFQPYGLFHSYEALLCLMQWYQEVCMHSKREGQKLLGQALKGYYQGNRYLAPEQLKGQKCNRLSDIYSLAVLIYEILMGKVPFGVFSLPSEENKSPLWDAFFKRCLQEDPKMRPQSYFEVKQMLDTIFSDYKEENQAPKRQDEQELSKLLKVKPNERLSLTPKGMIYIPSGKCQIGSPDCGQDALPIYPWETKGFYMDRVPVTNEQFARFVEETNYTTQAEREEGAPLWENGNWIVLPGISWKKPHQHPLPKDFMFHPVTQVSYEDALAYATWLGRRLPTEQEWEYAAKGGQGSDKYPWGENISLAQANYSSQGTCAVMRYSPNGYGVYDLIGNVWEWTDSYYQAYPGNRDENPHFGKKYRVIRGGAWLYDAAYCMLSYRNANQAEHAYPTVGFRTVCDFTED